MRHLINKVIAERDSHNSYFQIKSNLNKFISNSKPKNPAKKRFGYVAPITVFRCTFFCERPKAFHVHFQRKEPHLIWIINSVPKQRHAESERKGRQAASEHASAQEREREVDEKKTWILPLAKGKCLLAFVTYGATLSGTEIIHTDFIKSLKSNLVFLSGECRPGTASNNTPPHRIYRRRI